VLHKSTLDFAGRDIRMSGSDGTSSSLASQYEVA
jgi:hypothetical protein